MISKISLYKTEKDTPHALAYKFSLKKTASSKESAKILLQLGVNGDLKDLIYKNPNEVIQWLEANPNQAQKVT